MLNRAAKNVYPLVVAVRLSQAQYDALTRLAFQTGTSRAALGRMAILAMIDYEAHHLAEVAAAKLRHAAE